MFNFFDYAWSMTVSIINYDILVSKYINVLGKVPVTYFERNTRF